MAAGTSGTSTQTQTNLSDRGVVMSNFTGGLNNVADLSALDNTELASIINFEIDSSGSLVSRPPVVNYDGPASGTYASTRVNRVLNPDGVSTGKAYTGPANMTIGYITTGPWTQGSQPPPTWLRTAVSCTATATFTTSAWQVSCPGSVVVVGTTYTASLFVTQHVGANRAFQIGVRWIDSGGALISTSISSAITTVGGLDQWTRLSYNTPAAPTGTVTAEVGVRYASSSGFVQSGDVFYMTGLLLSTNAGNLFPPYSGNTPNTPAVHYAWTGTANNSNTNYSPMVAGSQLQIEFLGYYNRADGVNFMVLADANGTYLYNPVTQVYVTMTTVVASGCAQYQNRLYLCSRTIAGGWWGEVTVGSGTYTYQSLSTGSTPMPKGDQIVAYKDRLWLAGWGNSDERTKVYLSDLTTTTGGDINNWPVTNFFYVGRGDGQWITKLNAGPYDISIYRNASAYYFRYDGDPKLGTLTRYDGNIGCDTKYSLVNYQNYVYVLSNGGLYQLVSYQFYRRNDPSKMVFEGTTTSTAYSIQVALSVVGSRLLVWYQGTIYSYQLTTGIWSQWSSSLAPAVFRVIQKPEGQYGPDVAYGITGAGDPTLYGIYRITDDYNFVDSEDMVCSIRTKAYDYQMPDRYKVLFWWTADTLMRGTGAGNVVPVTLVADTVTWDDLDALPGGWDQMSMGTWDHPTIKVPGIVTDETSPANAPARVSLKFRKKLRFRRAYFEVSLDTDGTLDTGPAHIFSITTYVETRQKITRGVT